MRIEVKGLVKRFGSQVAIAGVDIVVPNGECLVLLGPSGCGKSTILRSLAGLETPTEGRISIGETVVFDSGRRISVPVNQRGVGMVFQSYAVWPHMTVYENVVFGLRLKRVDRQQERKRVAEALELVGLAGMGDRPATKLSGGQMQRVALARSLAVDPSVLLLDEPLSNLDQKLRERLMFDLKSIRDQSGVTMVYVTHDHLEAAVVGHRIGVMEHGALVQEGTAVDIFRTPRNRSVADFLGYANFLSGKVVAQDGALSRVMLDCGVEVRAGVVTEACQTGDRVDITIRPSDVRIYGPNQPYELPQEQAFPAQVLRRDFLGSTIRYTVSMDGTHLIGQARAGDDFAPGELVTAAFSPMDTVVMKPEVK